MNALLAEFYGIEAGPGVIRDLRARRSAGVLLLRRNVETPDQVKDLTEALRAEMGEGFEVAVRHEGGAVTPFVRGVTAFPGLEALEAAASPSLARDVGRAMGAELASMGITMNLIPERGAMAAQLSAGLRASGIKAGPGPVARAEPGTRDDADGAGLAAAVAALSIRLVRDPEALVPVPAGRSVGLLVPRLGDVADRIPVEESLRPTASLLRPQVGASVGVLEIPVQPDDASAAMAIDWLGAQEIAVFLCFQARRFAGQRRLLDALGTRCRRRIVATIGDSADESLAGSGSTVIRSCGFQACQLTAVLQTIFPGPVARGKRK